MAGTNNTAEDLMKQISSARLYRIKSTSQICKIHSYSFKDGSATVVVCGDDPNSDFNKIALYGLDPKDLECINNDH